MTWALLAILSALLWAFCNILDKLVVSKYVSKPLVPVLFSGLIGLCLSGGIYSIRGFESLSLAHWGLGLLAGVLYSLMMFFYFKSIQLEEVSKVLPLYYLSPMFLIVIAAVFLGELFTPLIYLGMFFLVAGAIAISSDEGFSLKFSKGFWFMILAGLCIAINQTLTKFLLDHADYWTIFGVIRIGGFLALTPFFLGHFQDLREMSQKNGVKPILVITLSEGLNLGAVLISTLAASIGFISLVNALQSIHPFFLLILTTLFSIFWPQILEEKITRPILIRKAVSIAVMFVGLVLIS